MSCNEASAQMPQYECHKKVWALKIASVQPHPVEVGKTFGAATITPAEEGYAPFIVSAEYVEKHSPRSGGYYVVYADGYKSWSPAEAFEAGYARTP